MDPALIQYIVGSVVAVAGAILAYLTAKENMRGRSHEQQIQLHAERIKTLEAETQKCVEERGEMAEALAEPIPDNKRMFLSRVEEQIRIRDCQVHDVAKIAKHMNGEAKDAR